jgi:hypothetical protein
MLTLTLIWHLNPAGLECMHGSWDSSELLVQYLTFQLVWQAYKTWGNSSYMSSKRKMVDQVKYVRPRTMLRNGDVKTEPS